MMRILITGGAGFVGSNLAIKLKLKHPEYEVFVIDNLVRRGSELNLPILQAHNISFKHADIRIAEDLEGLPKTDFIIDASADPSVLAGINSSTIRLIQSNLVGTVNLLELAKRNDAKFIFLSTSRVYPYGLLNDILLDETETRFVVNDKQLLSGVSADGISEAFNLDGARSFYGAAKLSSELIIQEYIALQGLQASILRCGVIAGPGQFGKVDQGVIVFWLASHFWKKELGYFGYGGKGKQVRDVLHVDDLFQFLETHLTQFDLLQGKTFNIGGGAANSFSLQELTSFCVLLTGNIVSMSTIEENRIADIPYYVTDNKNVCSITGWSPRHNIKTLLTDTFSWIKENEKQLKYILG